MKKTTLIFSLFFFAVSLFTFLPHAAAVDTSEWKLPEGAKARLGKGSINEITYSPDGSLLAVAGSIGIWIYDAQTGEELDLLTGYTSPANRIAFSPNGKICAIGENSGVVRLLDVATWTEIATLVEYTGSISSIAFSPNGKTLAIGSYHGIVRLLDVPTQMEMFRVNIGSVRSVMFSPDGRTLAIGSRQEISLWDVLMQIEIGTLDFGSAGSVVFSPDGTTLAIARGSGSGDKTVHLWDVSTQTEIGRLKGHSASVISVSFSPDGRTLASGSGDHTLRLWDVSTQTEIGRLKGHSASVFSVSFSPDGRTIATGSYDGTVRLWDVSTRREVGRLEGYTNGVNSVSFSPDSKTIASNGGVSEVRLWDVSTLTEIATLEEHYGRAYSVSFSPDGHTLASGNWDWTVRLWNVSARTEIGRLDGHTDDVKSVSFNPDSKTIASGSLDRTVRIWDVATLTEIGRLEGHTEDVYSVSFSPDGHTLVSGSLDRTVRIWDVATLTEIGRLEGHTDNVYSVSFSPDGKTIASGSRDRTVRIWDVDTQTEIGRLERHTRAVDSVSFSPDGRTIASGSWDGIVHFWDIATQTEIGRLEGHTGAVDSVVFSPDGRTLASGSSDGTVLLWQTPFKVSITPNPVVSPVIGEEFSINVSISGGENIGGYQLTVEFDPTALRYVSSTNGNYLTEDSYFVQPVVSDNKVTLGATNFAERNSGDGVLTTITFEVVDVKESTVDLSDVIITDSDGSRWINIVTGGKIVEPAPVSSSAVVNVTPSSVLSPARHQQFTLNVDIAGGQNIADYHLSWDIDEPLELVSEITGDYLADGIGNGDGTLFTGTFKVITVKTSAVSVSGHLIGTDGLRYIPTFVSATVVAPSFGDVNRDGVVDIRDLVQVASSFAQKVPEEGNPADVNEDGLVNIVDLVQVAAAIGNGAAAPTVLSKDTDIVLTREDVQKWLSQAQQFSLTDATSQRGILFLEQLLTALTPKETALLANYPNPFNPETWIPYQLATPADVTLTIYAADGTVVRTLTLGHQPVGIYQSKSRAVYWDGKNEVGELVASGLYFYTLTAGDFNATRKMLIRK